jgi:hypothetical protein
MQSSAWHLFSIWFLTELILKPWRWRRYVLPKRRLTFNWMHCDVSHSAHVTREHVLARVIICRPSSTAVGFESSWVYVESMADEVTLGHKMVQVLKFLLPVLIPQTASYAVIVLQSFIVVSTLPASLNDKCTRHGSSNIELNRVRSGRWRYGQRK